MIAGAAALFIVQPSTVQPSGATLPARERTTAASLETTRTFQLPAGRASRIFTLHEGSGVILINRLTVRRGVRVSVDARIPNLAEARVSTWDHDAALSCRRTGINEVCTQGEEWCPMPKATWHVRLVKLAGVAGAVRFDYVVAPPPHRA